MRGVIRFLVACVVVALAGLGIRALSRVPRGCGANPAIANLARVAAAMRAYHDTHGCFPPAFLTDGSGHPIHSWRVMLLPFLGEHELYRAYDFSRPWDDPANAHVTHSMPPVFSWPKAFAENAEETGCVVIVSEKGPFPGRRSCCLKNIDRVSAPVVMLVQCQNPGFPWTKPRDLTPVEYLDRLKKATSESSCGGLNVAIIEGAVLFVHSDSGPEGSPTIELPEEDFAAVKGRAKGSDPGGVKGTRSFVDRDGGEW
jgi:hypothetical protein